MRWREEDAESLSQKLLLAQKWWQQGRRVNSVHLEAWEEAGTQHGRMVYDKKSVWFLIPSSRDRAPKPLEAPKREEYLCPSWWGPQTSSEFMLMR